ncbi:MAG: helix-turn-helix domain-containing protein, partial [Eggerthellaceae bacterium]|nr:helix-turn-helix domain-containing protein [Eggerthellaceae bacterium]
GKVLRETRERKGYELDTVARRLRIRPDILRAIEAGDFDAMPPRGYTRNMVNAYARLLGLNPTEIVNMYLDEVYAHQVERARGNGPSSGFNIEREPRRSRARNRAMRYDDWDSESRTRSQSRGTQSRSVPYRRTDDGGASFLTRDLYDDRTEFSRDDYGITRERRERPGRSERDFMSHHSGYSETGYGYSSSIPRRGNRDIHVGQTPMEYKASRIPRFLQSRLVLIIAAIIVLAVIAVVAFTLLGHGAKADENDVSQLPVSGINDTTKSEDEEEEEAATVEVAPTSARVVYTVKSGNDCYIETYVDDGDVQPEMLTGPVEKSLEVTGTWTITTYSPDTISVTVDGSPITMSIDADRGGMYAYTVDFPAILEKWRQEHPSKSEQRSAAVASASNATDTSPTSDESASAETASGSSSNC